MTGKTKRRHPQVSKAMCHQDIDSKRLPAPCQAKQLKAADFTKYLGRDHRIFSQERLYEQVMTPEKFSFNC